MTVTILTGVTYSAHTVCIPIIVIRFFRVVNFWGKNFRVKYFLFNVLVLNIRSQILFCIIMCVKTIFVRFLCMRIFLHLKK